ncbi:uncharacterized protein LOC117924359 [Vitis riparia]|uniref:uncharacterized protein LOC117924359 n=1 Tax=Vitis riparia TaxID=96939 RepID=UPI00155AA715|nr:uncharacterized protein LOC117924359 [Vitis riparia]
MGTLVRSQHNVPIQVQDWNHVSEDVKEKIWALVLEKYELEETCKNYILQCCGNLFRSYRSKMKAKYYNPYNTDEERLCYQMMIGGGSSTFGVHRRPRISQTKTRQIGQNK